MASFCAVRQPFELLKFDVPDETFASLERGRRVTEIGARLASLRTGQVVFVHPERDFVKTLLVRIVEAQRLESRPEIARVILERDDSVVA